MLEEEKQPFTIETGDSVKVKQVLDDATVKAITEGGYEGNYSWENTKLLLMFVSCVFAMVAQFFPMPFPASRPLLAVCCAAYFIISSVLQYIVTFVDKDTILFTKPKEVTRCLRLASSVNCAHTARLHNRAFPWRWRFEQAFLSTRSSSHSSCSSRASRTSGRQPQRCTSAATSLPRASSTR
jgi:hypothetical protein